MHVANDFAVRGCGPDLVVLLLQHVSQRHQYGEIVGLFCEDLFVAPPGAVEVDQLPIGVPQLVERREEVGVALQRGQVRFDRFAQPLDRFAGVAQVIERLRLLRAQGDRLAIAANCFLEALAQVQCAGAGVMGVGVLRIEAQAAAIAVDGFVELLLVLERCARFNSRLASRGLRSRARR